MDRDATAGAILVLRRAAAGDVDKPRRRPREGLALNVDGAAGTATGIGAVGIVSALAGRVDGAIHLHRSGCRNPNRAAPVAAPGGPLRPAAASGQDGDDRIAVRTAEGVDAVEGKPLAAMSRSLRLVALPRAETGCLGFPGVTARGNVDRGAGRQREVLAFDLDAMERRLAFVGGWQSQDAAARHGHGRGVEHGVPSGERHRADEAERGERRGGVGQQHSAGGADDHVVARGGHRRLSVPVERIEPVARAAGELPSPCSGRSRARYLRKRQCGYEYMK